MAPLIYFSFGMTKSGSTLSFELARCALEAGGRPQIRLSDRSVLPKKKINFCNHIDADCANAIRAETKQIGYPIAIKTHTRPDPEVIRMIENREAIAHACFRDPREIALSMLDHARKSRKKGAIVFTEYKSLADTIENIRHQTNSLLAWLTLPNVQPLYYDDVAFDMTPTTQKIADFLGVAVNAKSVSRIVREQRFTQKNKAIQSRHLSEMEIDMSAHFKDIFAPMYERLIEKRHSFPSDGTPILKSNNPLCDWNKSTTLNTGTLS